MNDKAKVKTMTDIVLLCECGWADHPDPSRPSVWLTPEVIASLTKDHPVTQIKVCPRCGFDIYIMKKCRCAA